MSTSREQPTPPRPPVSIKGRGRDLRVVVEDVKDSAAVEQSLRAQLERRAGAFFSGAPVTIELPGDSIDFQLAAKLAAAIEDSGMHVSTVSAGGKAPPTRPVRAQAEPMAPPPAEEGAMIVERTLRSGQRLDHAGDVIVIGDVNIGAELVAGGSVIVWGRLRGTVEAGSLRKGAVVCALDLAPAQLVIGTAIARSPDDPNRNPAPEIAREIEGRIEVDDWR